MLTDSEYAAKMSIPDLTEKLDENTGGYDLRRNCTDHFSGDEWNGHLAWKRALDHAAYLNETHYEDHLTFRVVKYCQDYYVLDKVIAKQKFGLELSAPLPIL